jgi:uncharacterized protein (TIGR02271 family)
MANKREEETLGNTLGTTRNDITERDDMMATKRDAEVVPVVEEELAVGKRTVETGGVRVHKEVTARPVEESVNLHEEKVTVERRPVNREVRPEDMHAFENSTIEMREQSEEAVVEKRARVVEEVVVGKEEHERTEHIADTVRRTDVRVEPIAGTTRTSGDYDRMTEAFRSHFNQNYANGGWDYDTGYSHAYRYGYDLAGNGSDWSSVEPDVRSKWETRNKGTWENFKDAIRYGFDSGSKR